MSEPARWINGDELRRLVPMTAAVDALDAAFGGPPVPASPLRTAVEGPDGTLLVMPASDRAGMGVKLVTLNPANPDRGLPFIHAVYVLFRQDTLEPAAVIDGGALTALRTGAVSGVATRHLAREEADRLVVFGAGVQARSHLEAMCAVRPIGRLTVVSRSQDRAEALAQQGWEWGLAAAVGDPGAVAGADVVCTCTTSPDPIFEGSLLRPGTHVNAVGSYRPDARELDDEAVRGALVVVETREAGLAEGGDVIQGIEHGAIDPDRIAELGDVVRGRAGRTSPDDVTVFKSVGVAFEDLVVARAAFARATEGSPA